MEEAPVGKGANTSSAAACWCPKGLQGTSFGAHIPWSSLEVNAGHEGRLLLPFTLLRHWLRNAGKRAWLWRPSALEYTVALRGAWLGALGRFWGL